MIDNDWKEAEQENEWASEREKMNECSREKKGENQLEWAR